MDGMKRIPGARPEVIDALRELGYTVETWEQAEDAVERAYGLTGLEAGVLLTGQSDVEEVEN